MSDSSHLTAISNRAFPTVADLSELGADIARTGFAPHEHRLSSMVELARRSGHAPASIDVIVDRAAPEAVRARAFSILAGAWTDVLRGLRSTPEYRAFDAAFADLLAAWNDRQRLRSENSPLADRVAALDVLDRQRLTAARRRRRLTSAAVITGPETACA